MIRLFLLCGFALIPAICVGATTADTDLELARFLMRPGYDLAGVQAELLEGLSDLGEGWHEGDLPKLLIRDINGDGRKDVFMAVEKNPKIEDGQGHPCEKPDKERGCHVEWGDREIEVYYQQPDGSYRLGIRSGLIMDKEGGGMDPDPFKGFEVRPKGSIRIYLSGGAGWKWEYTYTVQFRKDDIYVIGAYEYLCNGARDDVECHQADVNLWTGQWWRTSWIGDGEQWQKREGKLKERHLYRLEDAFPENVGQWKGHGLDLELDWDITPQTRFSGYYAYQDNTDETTGKDAGYTPHHKLFGQLQHRHHNWFFNLQVTYIGDRDRVAEDTWPEADRYTLVDWLTRYTFSPHLEASLDICNVFDEKAEDAGFGTAFPGDIPLPGRTYYFSIYGRL